MKASMRFCLFVFAGALYGLAATALAGPIPARPAPGPPSQTAEKPAPTLQAVPEKNVAPDAVIITIGTETITRARFELLLSALAENGRPTKTAAERRRVAEQYADLQRMVQEARKRKLDSETGVKQMMAIERKRVLANALVRRVSGETHVRKIDLRSYYDTHKNEFEEAKISHILIRFKGAPPAPSNRKDRELTEPEALAKAQNLRKQILAGSDFARLAKANSEDPGSASKGGDLGTLRRGAMVPELDRAAFTLPIGEVSEPVKTQSGYELIKIESRTTKTLDEATPQIEKELKPKMLREAMEQIKSHVAVTFNEAYFGAAPVPATTPRK
jgi:hypothetical protein